MEDLDAEDGVRGFLRRLCRDLWLSLCNGVRAVRRIAPITGGVVGGLSGYCGWRMGGWSSVPAFAAVGTLIGVLGAGLLVACWRSPSSWDD
jgi:hypothetical protein